ncbi:MAG: Fe-S cluster assembly protein IscX [Terriglobia bacterium]
MLNGASILDGGTGKMDWDDTEEIAEQLSSKHPEIKDPFTIRFVELLQWVVNLEGFEGEKNPKTSMEGKLENIVQAWSDYIG